MLSPPLKTASEGPGSGGGNNEDNGRRGEDGCGSDGGDDGSRGGLLRCDGDVGVVGGDRICDVYGNDSGGGGGDGG